MRFLAKVLWPGFQPQFHTVIPGTSHLPQCLLPWRPRSPACYASAILCLVPIGRSQRHFGAYCCVVPADPGLLEDHIVRVIGVAHGIGPPQEHLEGDVGDELPKLLQPSPGALI